MEYDSSLDSSDEFTSNAHAFIALFLNAFELLSGRRPGVPTHITWIDVRVKISVLSDSANHYESSAPVYNSPTVHNHDNAGDQDNDILEDVNLKENVECDSSLELSDEFISNSCVSGISLGTRGAFSFWYFARNRGLCIKCHPRCVVRLYGSYHKPT